MPLGSAVFGGNLGVQELAAATGTIQPVAGVTSNPYIRPVKTAIGEIQLASNGDKSVGGIHLVPIGRAMGLHPIMDGDSPHPVGPVITIDPVVAAPVRGNPMATRNRQPNLRLERINDLSTTGTGSLIRQTGNEEDIFGGMLEKPSPSVRATSPIAFSDAPQATQDAAASIEAASPVLEAAVKDTSISMNRIEPGSLSEPADPVAEKAGVVQESQAISFSLSDSDESIPANLSAEPESPEDIVATASDNDPSDSFSLSLSDSPTPESRPNKDNFGPDIAPIVSDAVPALGIVPLPPSPSDVVSLDEAREATAESANEMLRRNRYRAPVDVTSIPGSIERLMVAQDESSTVAAVDDVVAEILNSMNLLETADSSVNELVNESPLPEIEQESTAEPTSSQTATSVLQAQPLRQPPKLQLPEGMTAIPLHLNFAQVRSLTLGGSLKDIRVMDQNICQAVATGPNQIKLIGTGNGVTQLVVWAEVDGVDNPTRMQAFEIHVDSHENSAVADDSLGMLSQSIQQTFPNSQVQLDALGDRVRISGRCLSEDSAKKILRMVRRTCLIPVEDNLEVR